MIHNTACIDKGVQIGERTNIWHFTHLLKDVQIGTDCIIGQNCMIGPHVVIGNGVKIQNNVSVYQGVTLEDHVFLGPSMVFTNVINPRAFLERKNEFLPTLVKQGATIGANATLICGVTIGRFALIGAGSVVTRDVPDFALVYGNPAKHQGWISRAGNKLHFDRSGKAMDSSDSSKYVLEKNQVYFLDKTGKPLE